MQKTAWKIFFDDKVREIFNSAHHVIDIGGGLRINREKNNRYDSNRSWIIPLAEKVDYKIVDPVDTYKPDIVGDIHALPFGDNSIDGIFCLAVLEHIENPFTAVEEMRRVLKPRGKCLVYVPFLFYYHAEASYYKDYWRFSKDALELLFKNFSAMEIQSVRGAIETWFKISPLGRYPFLAATAHLLDKLTGKINTSQVSGYYIFLQK